MKTTGESKRRFDVGSAWTAGRHTAATGQRFERDDFTTDQAFAIYEAEAESYRRQFAVDAKWIRTP